MKKYIYYLIIFLFLLFPCHVLAVVKPTSDFYVNDYANILSSETEQYILDKSIALNRVDGTQIVVVTVPNLEGDSLEDYANKLFNSWGIGNKKENNGLLLLLALEEREFRVEVGDGLEGILPDGKTGRFQDQYIIPYLRDNNWNEGIKNGYNAFYSEIVKLNNLNLEYDIPSTTSDDSELPVFEVILAILGFFLQTILGQFAFTSCLVSIFLGAFIRSRKDQEKKDKLTKLYFIILAIIAVLLLLLLPSLLIFVFINLMFFIAARFGTVSGSGGGSGRSRSSFSSSRSSGGFSSRSSGGGGRSSGGGSSRRF